MNTDQNVDKFIADSKAANRGFNQAEWDKVKNTIPAGEQSAAETRAHAGLK